MFTYLYLASSRSGPNSQGGVGREARPPRKAVRRKGIRLTVPKMLLAWLSRGRQPPESVVSGAPS